MPTEAFPQLTHAGIYVHDLAKMEAFYREVVGLVPSDRGPSRTFSREFVFFTGDPEKHHQFVMVSGRDPETPSTINQLSFHVPTLEALRRVYRRARRAGIEKVLPLNHGNAFSVYFDDPEGNLVEIYTDTPWYTPQPFSERWDPEGDEAALLRHTEALCRGMPGFQTREEWKQEIAARLREAADTDERE